MTTYGASINVSPPRIHVTLLQAEAKGKGFLGGRYLLMYLCIDQGSLFRSPLRSLIWVDVFVIDVGTDLYDQRQQAPILPVDL